MKDPPPEKIINLEGPPGKTVFRRILTWCLPSGYEQNLQHRIDYDILERVQNLDDDRLLALVGSLVFENSINSIMASIMPGYGNLAAERVSLSPCASKQ